MDENYLPRGFETNARTRISTADGKDEHFTPA